MRNKFRWKNRFMGERKTRLGFYLVLLSLLTTTFTQPLFSERDATEKIDPTEGYVYDVLDYQLTLPSDRIVHLPELGDYQPQGSDLPIAEILSIREIPSQDHSHKTIHMRLRFFVPGDFSLPVSWESPRTPEPGVRAETKDDSKTKTETKTEGDPDSEIQNSQIPVKVLSRLDSPQEEEADSLPPIYFGQILYGRILILLLGGLGLVSGIYYARHYWTSRPRDAIVLEPPPPVPQGEILSARFRALLQHDPISKKEFAYLLSLYLKDRCEEKFGFRTGSYTDSQLLEKIYQSTPIGSHDIRSAKVFFLYSKYKPHSDTISRDEATQLLELWKRNLV